MGLLLKPFDLTSRDGLISQILVLLPGFIVSQREVDSTGDYFIAGVRSFPVGEPETTMEKTASEELSPAVSGFDRKVVVHAAPAMQRTPVHRCLAIYETTSTTSRHIHPSDVFTAGSTSYHE